MSRKKLASTRSSPIFIRYGVAVTQGDRIRKISARSDVTRWGLSLWISPPESVVPNGAVCREESVFGGSVEDASRKQIPPLRDRNDKTCLALDIWGCEEHRLWHTEFMHRITLGDFELSVFSDGTYPLDGGAFFGVIPKVMWSKKVAADENNYCTAGLNSLLIRTGKENVLVETGMGNKLSERMRKFYGQPAKLLENLSAAGVAPEDIDIVINSHLHFDHCGWNTVRDKNGKVMPTFPKAKYYAPEGEWLYARKPSDRDVISYIPDNYDPLVASGQMTLLQGGEEIVPGISVKTFPGHTASMQGIIVNGHPGLERARLSAAPVDEEEDDGALAPEGAVACYISDLMPTTAHMDLTWGMGFDLYPLDTIANKKEYYARALPERWLTVFTHDPKVPWAYIEREESGRMVARKPD
ncbi:MAG TPA: MBL fold metallo-hydrolase [Candidatus Sulfotelmatobacter sp.]|nr:MBL fold metallo-hydrolase [Candidatus Sulfotelmatobacter sp.]